MSDSDFLNLIESMDASRASIQNLFGNEGPSVQNSVSSARQRLGPKYEERLTEAVGFIKQVFTGRRPIWQLKEALSTSDFPLLFGDTIDRMMIAQFRMYEPTYPRFMRMTRVRDFRSVKRFRVGDGDQSLQRVPQGGSYPQGELDEASFSFSVNKYGRRMDILWEALVNDDLDALRDIPQRFARAARRSRMRFATSQYVGNNTLYSATHSVNGANYSNTSTLPLNVTNLKAAWNTMLTYSDEANSDGVVEPIENRPVFLVVDPVLELNAAEILNTLIVQWTDGTSSGPTPQATNNQMAGRLEIVPDPYIRILDPTNGATSWYLFASPDDLPAVEIAELIGHEEPQMFMKSPNAIRLGGGDADPMQGDFDTDSVGYKVRDVIGGSHMNAVGGWRGTYRSVGTG
jgi:hypothetical protein